MAATEQGILGLVHIKDIFDVVQDQRQVPQEFTFRNRVNKVPATDADIIGRFLGQAHIADIVGDDQKANTYAAARIKFETNLIPNIKLGRALTQEDLKRLEFLAKNAPANVESMGYEAYFQREAENLLLGIEMREESMLVGLEIDQFTYSRNDMVLNINWGMPAELKATVAVAWTDSVNATPFADIQNMALIRQTKYGRRTDRVKLSYSAFRYATRTTEFTNQVRNFFLNSGQPTPSVPYQSTEFMKNLVGRILSMDVELYDNRYPTHPTNGSAPFYTPYLPLNKVILDSKDNDGNNTRKDFANGVVTESLLEGPTPAGARGGQYGPYTYTSHPADRNPPTVTFWAVERGMPRKFDEALTSVLDVGAISDFITPGIAF